jgi:hypothetical protein
MNSHVGREPINFSLYRLWAEVEFRDEGRTSASAVYREEEPELMPARTCKERPGTQFLLFGLSHLYSLGR